jgi:hypothetical protein
VWIGHIGPIGPTLLITHHSSLITHYSSLFYRVTETAKLPLSQIVRDYLS